MSDLEALEAAYERAWLDYNDLQRALPDCEHVRAWHEQVAAARKRHLAALRDFDRAALGEPAEVPPEPATASPPSPDDTSRQEPLPGLEAA